MRDRTDPLEDRSSRFAPFPAISTSAWIARTAGCPIGTYTVVPNGEGSIAQGRAWVEAQIGSQTRTVELDVNRPYGASHWLQYFGGR